MTEFIATIANPDMMLANLAGALLVLAFFMQRVRDLRVLALLATLAALAHIVIRGGAVGGMPGWVVMVALANGAMLALLLYRSHIGILTTEERELLEAALQVEEPAQQRRLLDLLEWSDVDPGHVLMRQGDANPPLIYISSGEAAAARDGQTVGNLGPGDFIGEMSLVLGEGASATVTVTQTARVASFDRDSLLRMAQAMPELSRAIDHALNRGLAAKIARMNQAMAGASD